MYELTEERLDRLMAYCRIDREELSPAELALLGQMAQGQMAYLEGAGIPPPAEPHKLAIYELAVNALTLDAWDHRAAVADGTRTDNPQLRRVITQLKLG